MSSFKEIEYLVAEKVDEKGRLVKRTWRRPRRHCVHREGGPAVEHFDPETGKCIGEVWIDDFNHGKHRDSNLPSDISIDPKSGVVKFEEYYRNGRLHRDDGGPAEIHRDGDTGHATCFIYSFEGYRHRDGDLPAVLEFDSETGQLTREEYYREGERHRDTGAAVVEYDKTGAVIPNSLQYYRNDQKLNPSPAPCLDRI